MVVTSNTAVHWKVTVISDWKSSWSRRGPAWLLLPVLVLVVVTVTHSCWILLFMAQHR